MLNWNRYLIVFKRFFKAYILKIYEAFSDQMVSMRSFGYQNWTIAFNGQ